jgi:putative ABC transport system permease protein
MILRNALLLVLPGVLLGLAIALIAARAIAGLLYGVSAIDPWSYLLAITVLPVIAIIASIIPARRATRIQPLEALRQS